MDLSSKDLHVLDIPVEVSHQTLERLCRECTELRTLYLEEGSTIFTDELLILLTDHCHFMKDLSLAGAVGITDTGMCYFLKRFGQQLKVLYIEQCLMLTDVTLIAIAEYCTQLHLLDITGTGITADAVITHLMKPNHHVFRLSWGFSAGSDILERLRIFQEGSEPTGDSRVISLQPIL